MAKHLARALAAAAFLLAATPAAAAPNFPDVYVTETVVDQPGPFRAGETVSGHFTVRNLGQDTVDLPTSVDLLTDFRNGFPVALVDSYQLDAIRVGPQATVRVPFSVSLPRAFSGQAGFQGNIEIAVGRNRTSPPTTPFLVADGIARASIEAYRLELSDGQRVFPFAGPSIYRAHEPSGATLSIDVSAAEAFSVTPQITLYESTDATGTPPLWEGFGGATSLAAGTTTTVRVPLPDLGYPDKVVLGTFRLVDQTGVDRSGVAYFRYIPRSGEPIGKLVSFSFQGEAVAGNPLAAIAAVAGDPIDFSVPPASTTPTVATVRLEALDARGRVVASASSTTALSAEAVDVPLSLSLPEVGFLAYRATLVAVGGRELDRREGVLFGERPTSVLGSSLAVPLAVGVLAAFLVLALVVRFVRRRGVPPAAAAAAALSVAIACALGLGAAANAAEGGAASIDFSQPIPAPNVYQCGVPIPVAVSAAFDVCYNSGADVDLWVTMPGLGEVARAPHQSYSANGSHAVEGTSVSAFVNMPLPVRNGTYTLTAHLVGGSGVWQYNVTKDQTFQVVGCDVCANIVGDQNVVPSGMARDNAGNCQRSGGGGSSDDCPSGYKWCNGACVPNATNCAPPPACPLPDTGEQYCVELFDRSGTRTGQLAGLSLEDLEKVFGFGVREAFYARSEADEAGLTTYPIFGVVGRSASGAVTANQGSTGCAGVSCAYEVNGCIVASDLASGKTSADCSAIGDVPGPTGLGPRADINVVPPVVGKGGRCQVTWGSHEMSSCQVAGKGISASTLAGATSTPPLQDSASYVLTCVGQDQKTYRDSASCSVNPDVREF